MRMKFNDKSWGQLVHEIPEQTRIRVSRMMANADKIYGLRRRLLRSQYKPRYNSPRNDEQARLEYLLSRGINPVKAKKAIK